MKEEFSNVCSESSKIRMQGTKWRPGAYIQRDGENTERDRAVGETVRGKWIGERSGEVL